MRNGTHSNLTHSKLTLVDNSQDTDDDAAAYYPYRPENESAQKPFSVLQNGSAVFVLAAVSAACVAAAVATGSYAIWLARHQATRQALTDVNDILRSCQTRMSQLEVDVQRLPNRQA